MKKKSKVFTTFKQWKMLIEKQFGKRIKHLHTHNGMEFYLKEFGMFCKNEEIVRHRTVARTPQQNGVAEHMNRTLLERAVYAFSSWFVKIILGRSHKHRLLLSQ